MYKTFRLGNRPTSFSSAKERDEFLAESLKHGIVADFHRLSEEIGRKEALKFLKKEITSLPF